MGNIHDHNLLSFDLYGLIGHSFSFAPTKELDFVELVHSVHSINDYRYNR